MAETPLTDEEHAALVDAIERVDKIRAEQEAEDAGYLAPIMAEHSTEHYVDAWLRAYNTQEHKDVERAMPKERRRDFERLRAHLLSDHQKDLWERQTVALETVAGAVLSLTATAERQAKATEDIAVLIARHFGTGA